MVETLRFNETGSIGFGGAAVSGPQGGYSFAGLKEEESISLLRQAFDSGLRLFDTAPIYGFGQSERSMGRAFKNCREKVFLSSKSGVSWSDKGRVYQSNNAELTRKMLEQSLRDLESDYIDLYMIHWPDPKVDIRIPMEVLAKARLEGKIKFIGLANTQREDLEQALEVDAIEVVQSQFNTLVSDREILERFKKLKIGFQSWGTLDKGILTGRVSQKRELAKDYSRGDCRRKAPWWGQKEVLKKASWVEKIKPIVEGFGHSLLEWAMGYNLVLHQVDQVLLGAHHFEQWQQIFKAAENLPSRQVLLEIQKSWEEIISLP